MQLFLFNFKLSYVHAMKNLYRTTVLWQTLLFLLFCGFAAAANPVQLKKIEQNGTANGSSQVIVLHLTGPVEPKVFTIGGENPRVVFDFPGVIAASGLKDFKLNGKLVSAVRVGVHNKDQSMVRLVFDVHTLKNLKYTYSANQGNQLSIRFAGPGETNSGEAKKDNQAAPPGKMKKDADAKKETKKEQEPPKKEVKKAAKPEPAPQTKEQVKLEKPAAPKAKEEIKAVPKEELPAVSDRGAGNQNPFAPPPEGVIAAQPKSSENETAKTESVAGAADADMPSLLGIQFDPDSPKGELVQFKLNGFYPPVLRSIESGTPQIICEFSNVQVAPALEGPIKIAGRHVKNIRMDKTAGSDKVRFFIELEPHYNYDLQQVFFKKDNFFVLIINTVKK